MQSAAVSAISPLSAHEQISRGHRGNDINDPSATCSEIAMIQICSKSSIALRLISLSAVRSRRGVRD
jgi:hypothetical protein